MAPSSQLLRPAVSTVYSPSGARDPVALMEVQRPCPCAKDVVTDTYVLCCSFVVATPQHKVQHNVAK